MMNDNVHCDDEGSCDSETDIAFASVDFSGVNFEVAETENLNETAEKQAETIVLKWETQILFGDLEINVPDLASNNLEYSDVEQLTDRLKHLIGLLSSGKYIEILESTETSKAFFRTDAAVNETTTKCFPDMIRNRIFEITNENSSISTLLEIEILGIAAMNLFLQSNYTGPSLHHDDDTIIDKKSSQESLDEIDPHRCFPELVFAKARCITELKIETISEGVVSNKSNIYQNAILSELAVDGHWPCQVCYSPYFLLLARSIFLTLADPERLNWSHSHHDDEAVLQSSKASAEFIGKASKLRAASFWNARSIVAHERLLQAREPSVTLWNEVDCMFQRCIAIYCPKTDSSDGSIHNHQAACTMLEWGLAEHYFDKTGKGIKSFNKALEYTGLEFEVTGAIGKRTKFQFKATAQMLVKAKSVAHHDELNAAENTEKQENQFKDHMIEHSEEEILLEKIKFDEDKENEIQHLSVLDQCILLALCLDVKNTNPVDGLTNEQMGAFLTRVLDHHDDWMVYSTALLERSWVEFESLHARERSLLQIQALVDQHTNRLTITQSTRKSIEESAPVQDRLRHLHFIVYPPRWAITQDLADRYAHMGIVSTAAELYLQIELWDYVVECYKRAGRSGLAEKIVRERLAVEETPRMWNALGDITNDPTYYEKAIELSKGKFSNSYLALGSYYFEKGELEKASENYKNAVRLRPLHPEAWFRLGTIYMQIKQWDDSLRAFSEVVMQEPEDADAWANIAAIHMHNKRPSEAYPALVESLKQKRLNWRVWLSKLYVCLDLNKYDEAVLACNVLLDLQRESKAKDGIPPLEEKCVRGIVGGAIQAFHEAQGEKVAFDSARRTLTRVNALLDRISSTSDTQPWIFEIMAYFHEQTGNNKELLDDLMKEYRALQTISGWERDDHLVGKVQQVVSQIVRIYQQENSKENLNKAKFLIRGTIQKIETARAGFDESRKQLEAIDNLKRLLEDVDERIQVFS